MTARRILFFLAVVSAVSIFAQLGRRGLNEPDEGRVAGIAKEMYSNHEILIPRLYDHAHFNKPPLVYWLLMLCFSVGGINEWMARFPPAFAACGTILLTASLARRLWGVERMLAAGLMLLTCPLFSVMSQLTDYNMMLTFWTTLAFWSVIAWMQDGKPYQRLTFYAALALACLTKGPVGPAIVLLALLGFRLRAPLAVPWRALWSWPLAIACLCASLSWFVLVATRYPELWSSFLRGEIFDRFFTNEHDRFEPLLYYAAILPLAVLPWLVPLFRATASGVRAWSRDVSSRYLLSWVALPLLLFTVSRSKTPTYILPLLPALALLAANATRLTSRALLVTTGLLVVAYHAAGVYVTRNETELGPQSTTRSLARIIQREARPGDRIALVERHPRGLSFYLEQPVSVPTYKFRVQIESDQQRVGEKDFDDPAKIFRWFDSTQRVFMVCSKRVAEERNRDAWTKPRELYRDSNLVLISNR